MFCRWKHLLALLWGISLSYCLLAQTALPAYQPTRPQMMEAYRDAAVMDSLARQSIFKTYVRANWAPDSKSFWYKNKLAGDTAEFVYVDAAKGRKKALFDNEKLAVALSKVTGKTITAATLPVDDVQPQGKQWLLKVDKQWYSLNTKDYNLEKAETPAGKEEEDNPYRRSRWYRNRRRDADSLSPDKQWMAYIKDFNVYIQPAAGGEAIAYTTDGTEAHPYGELRWSPDSKYLVGYHIDPVEIKPVYYILTAVEGTTRGQLKSHPYAQPGDPFTSYEMFVFPVNAKTALKVNTPKYDFLGMPRLRWRKDNSRYFSYEKADRGHQRFRIIEVDAQTGETRNIIDEQTKTFIYEQRIFTEYLDETNEIIWSSEKDGWRHLYLVNALTGAIKPITQGKWVVRDIDSIDVAKRQIWFRASGMTAGEDPYNIHYYRINFDGTGLFALTPAEGQHRIDYSPDHKYYTDTYSTPETAPVTELRRTADAKLVTQLETADISRYLALGLRIPEVFHAKGRDGQTDIWGIVCRPSHFDSTKRYPVIENIYAGPQDSFVPKTFMSYGEMQSMAELGFIVVQCDGMGTANRSKAFHDVCWKNLADAGLPDRIAWIKALAAKYAYVDTARVGLYGTSAGGQNSTGALLFHPEFYKVAVSAAGCHDNRVDKQWWNEQWMGYPVGPHYAAQSNVTNAYKLQGDLLLIVGEADTNVPPESTYRVVDALIKAGKIFDLLTVPGMDHSDGGPYGRKKKRDFFVKHLLDVDPPNRNRGEL